MAKQIADIRLGVNVDHVATLRQARGTKYPDPIHAALICEQAGADGIVVHLREDRRHIQDRDVKLIKELIKTKLNLEMAVTDEMVKIASVIKPDECCLVPEKREELTTEGGLDVINNFAKIKDAITELKSHKIKVSLFIDANQEQIYAAKEVGASIIELHTGKFADANDDASRFNELRAICEMARIAHGGEMQVNAGHGLTLNNVSYIAKIPEITELNIGHSIISDAIFSGLGNAVCKMKNMMHQARAHDLWDRN